MVFWSELLSSFSRKSVRREETFGQGGQGKLEVLGTGMSFADVTEYSKSRALTADVVFYLGYDQLFESEILSIRPDAINLFAFYQTGLARHRTYVQMAEAMIQMVRRDFDVVCYLYGHPGLFATPAHRAVEIVRKEGYIAKMRPGISALDCLIADIGFDPALPGLAMFEASDMLLRRRALDPSLHIVLWQVGVVGDFSFDANGYSNHAFDVLIERLLNTYNMGTELIHYIAPTYPGHDALVERVALADLQKPEHKSRVRSISTFYIPPQVDSSTDFEVAKALRLVANEAGLPPPQRFSTNSSYGREENETISAMSSVAIPEPVHRNKDDNLIALFFTSLMKQPYLIDRYVEDPNGLLEDPQFSYLSTRSKRLLGMRHSMATRTAFAEEQLRISTLS